MLRVNACPFAILVNRLAVDNRGFSVAPSHCQKHDGGKRVRTVRALSMNAEEICNAVETGELKPTVAIARLQQLGYTEAGAGEIVFISLGGDDCVEIGTDGVARFYGSGKPVLEVESLLSE